MTEIFTDNSGNTYSLFSTVGSNTIINPGITGGLTYFFNNITAGVTYEFVVVAYNGDGYTGYAGPNVIFLHPFTLIYAYGSTPYGYAFGVTWPTEYNNQKGLEYYYPHISYYPAFLGPDPAVVLNKTYSMANDTVTVYGWTGIGSLIDNYYNFNFDNAYLRQPHVPADFTFGATGHGITLYANQIIQAYSWIPPQHRQLHSSKSWSAYNTVSGICGAEWNLQRFNYLTRGNSFTNWSFSSGATFNSYGHTGPNGVTTGTLAASKIIFSGTSIPLLSKTCSIPVGGWTYTASIFIQGITANSALSMSIAGASAVFEDGLKTLGTAWNRYQVIFNVQNPTTVTLEIHGNDGTPGITWASEVNIWGGQIEQANGLSLSSAAYPYFIETGSSAASVISSSGTKAFWLARKTEYVEKELRNLFNYFVANGFTMGAMTIDDEGYYQYFTEGFNSLFTDYVWEYNSLYQNESATGNTWFISTTGICAQPKCMLQKTSRFGVTGVTNFRDLLLLRGFTTNASSTGYIDALNFKKLNNKNAISNNDPRQFMASVFNQAMTEMISYFVEDGMVTPFKELMLGNTLDTTSLISNYGYVDNYVAFVGNTYTGLSGSAITTTLSNFTIPNIQTLFQNTDSTGLVSTQNILNSFYRFEGDIGYSIKALSYNKCGNYSAPSVYGTWHGSGPGYGYYLYDSLEYPGGTAITDNMEARSVFDWNNSARSLNYYGYTGATWANIGQAAYTVSSFMTGRTRTKQVHVPGIWRGITMSNGNGSTFSCTSCFDSNSATYTGVSAGRGVTCLGCNDQTTYTIDYFMNSLWGITQATEYLSPVSIIPASLRAAYNGYKQGQLTQEWASKDNGQTPSKYFSPCGTPIPGVTLVPGTIYKDYDTHWYWMGWLGFITDLGQHRESATTRVYEALEKRNRLGDPSIEQDPYTIWVHTPTYALQGILNTWVNGPNYEYRHDITSYGYLRPLGITYDLITWYFSDTGQYQNRGATVFYGDINHYWAENIRHAYLHKIISIEQWGAPTYGTVVSPGRNTQTYRYNQPWEKGTWAKSYGDMRGLIDNPNEIRAILGNDKVFTPPASFLPGTSGCTLGGVCAPMGYKLCGERINTLLRECNVLGGGMVHETMYLAPINWAEKEYAFSGAQLRDGRYLWRITFLNKATQPIYVKGSRFGDASGITYNITGVTNFIDNANHEKGIWWSSNSYELPIVTNPPLTPNNGLPPGTTTWNGTDKAGSSPQFPYGIANTSVLF